VQIDWDELFKGDLPRPQPVHFGRRWLVVVAILVLFFFGSGLVGLLTDWWWFQSLGQAAVLQTRVLVPLGLFLAAWALGTLWLAGNWLWASRKVAGEATFKGQVPAETVRLATRRTVLAAAVGLAALFALGAAGYWSDVLLLLHRQPFGTADPLFGRDIGFYVFELPVWQAARGLAVGWVLAALVGAVLLYGFGGLAELGRGHFRLDRSARGHVLALGALAALLWAAGMWLSRYALLFTAHTPAFFGPGHADVTARLPVYALLTGVGIVVAGVLLVATRTRSWRLPAWAVAIAAGLWLVAGVAYPALIQAWRVRPNELTMEKPYINHNITATRAAFGLGNISTEVYQPTGAITPKTVSDNVATIANIRLWDWRIFQETVSQVQSIRTYYGFKDVDVDRYPAAAGHRQVNLTLRELLPEALQNPSWVNKHLEYTHGFGAVVSPIDEVADRGLPVLWVKDIPPVTTPPFTQTLTQPRVYFGEAADNTYLVVGAKEDEFDYPSGDQNVRNRYSGADGVPAGSLWRRLVFALRFGDGEILLSSAFTPESKLLLYRNVEDRVRKLAPFLTFDHDPYTVITNDGRLVWILDAYTATDRYPYSTPLGVVPGTDDQLAELQGASYVRNSVKVALDAYDGTVTFYAADPSDPLLKAWSEAFPTLFPDTATPPDLKAHWRYPETLFRAQTATFADYHVVDPATFYNAEDRWAIPNEAGLDGRMGPMPPYYVSMRLRGETEPRPEFVLILPFSPVGKDNMIAWLAARSDPAHYGQLVLYQFAKGSLVYGPSQIASLVQQDPAISAQVTLWGQSGSRVSYGNLLVIPLGDGILYAEPMYLRSDQGAGNAVPELKRVIVAVKDRVSMRETMPEALAGLFEAPAVAAAAVKAQTGGAGAGATPAPGAATPAAATDVAGLVREARAYQAAGAAALAQGDWLAFGRAMDGLQRTLAQLGTVTGVGAAPLTAPGAPAAGTTPGAGAGPTPAATP
jgi:uncharacterized protein